MLIQNFRHHFLSSTFLYGLQIFISNCADSGLKLPADKSLAGEEYGEDGLDAGVRPDSMLLQPDLLHQRLAPGESCRAAENLTDPYMGAGIDADDYPFQVVVEGGIKVKIGRNEQGLWLSLDDDSTVWNGRQLDIRLTRIRLDELAWLQVADVRAISWRQTGIFAHYPDGWQKLHDQRIARSWLTTSNLTVFLANMVADVALEGMFWGIELSLKDSPSQSRQLGQWLFRGEAPVWHGLMGSQRCRFSSPELELETIELWDQSVEDVLNERTLVQHQGLVRKALLDASFALKSIRQSPMVVPIIMLPPEALSAEFITGKQGILWLDRRIAAKSNLQMRQGLTVYQHSLHFLIRRILTESLTSNDDQWLEIMSWAMTDRYLLGEYGLYEQVMYLNQAFTAEASLSTVSLNRRRLAHLLAHRFSVVDLVDAWGQCYENSENGLQSCLLARLFHSPNPPEMAAWLWAADSYHPDWQPSLVDDDDGDGLINLLELKQGTDPRILDTDSDGWSDFAENIHQTDGRSAVSHPPGLVIDGWFDDWITLLPHKVKVNKENQTSACSELDLLYFSVFQSKEWLVIGAKLASQQDHPLVRWEVSLDFSEINQSFLVQQDAGSYQTNVLLSQLDTTNQISILRPFRNQPKDLELLIEDSWLFRQHQLSSETPGEWRSEKANLKISIYLGDGQGNWRFCEDTPWFEPVKVETMTGSSQLTATF